MEATSELFGTFSDSKQIYAILDTINRQRHDSKLCDVTLRILDEEIYAHSNVLAAASPYFDALFSGQDLPRMFSQKSPQIIEIHIDGPNDPAYTTAVQRVVDFMYTSQIYLDSMILTQVQEIAKIMQMANVIEFCDMFQQGYTSYNKEKVKPLCRDVLIQTENFVNHERNDAKKDFEVFVFNKSGDKSVANDETWTFSKNLRKKYKKKSSVLSGRHRNMRGRPRKVNNQKISFQVAPTESSNSVCVRGENDEKENEKVNIDNDTKNEDDSNIDKNVSVSESTMDIHSKVKINDEGSLTPKLMKTNPPLKVSKRGRIIKPKVFSDGVVNTIKQEILSDVDSDDDNENSALHEYTEVDSLAESSDKSYGENTPDNEANVKVEMGVGLFVCDQCDFKTTKMKEYNDHHREHLHAEKKCSYCGWICDNPAVSDKEFMEHLKNHAGPEPFFCNFCCARFKTRTKLFLHLPKHSKNKPFVCEICHTGFKWKHALKNHMIVHKNTKDYLCDICGFSTAHKTQLKAHHLIHTGNTFKCMEPDCDYQATKKTNLKFHMMTHTREKPHQCEVCGTSFSLVKNMKRHMLLHTSDRPYKCETCSFTTTRFDKLKEHYFKQHNIGEKPAKKFRLSEYIRMQEGVEIANIQQEIIKASDNPLDIGEDMETIEVQVAAEENGSATTQIVNVQSSTGEAIPITITQVGSEITYEIPQYPIQFVTQDVVTDN